ncbi:MAG: hypothetical protein H6806_03210 [Planctomycetes bacterium]|nr:hypothetical protein [Planctomycetota bacterium]MCB9825300.1 hypothetical protein [Planctomycetota bacterium]MCB9828763.1 hypothetical protein [Planctomycetota bacterium]MCB9900786.1 hypothetical protein [Planctomycetota bacterium]
MSTGRLASGGGLVLSTLVASARVAAAAEGTDQGFDFDWRWILLAVGIVIVITIAIRVGQGIALRQADRKVVGRSRERLRRGHGGDQAPASKRTER